MEEFLGVLFCGGKGLRLGEITRYISKSLLPVYDTPVFKFGLKLLEDSKAVNEIIILTNKENDSILRLCGYKTLIQDDSRVSDMLSGWKFIKDITLTKKHGVLVPCDNICEITVDSLIREFKNSGSDFLFSLHKMDDKKKLSEMGSFDTEKNKFYYKDPNSKSSYGVIAPYIINNNLEITSPENIFESEKAGKIIHIGSWFDIGDYDSLLEAANWRQKNKSGGS